MGTAWSTGCIEHVLHGRHACGSSLMGQRCTCEVSVWHAQTYRLLYSQDNFLRCLRFPTAQMGVCLNSSINLIQ